MKSITKLMLLTVFLSMILSGIVPSAVYACSCARPQEANEQFSRSQQVFSGWVLDVKEQRHMNGSLTKAALFEVSRVWKGSEESQIIIHTGSGGGDCGFHFEKNKSYLVYARPSTMYGDNELLITIICDRTSGLEQAQADLAVLGEGKAPTKQVHLEGRFNGLYSHLWVAMIGMAAAAAVILWYVWRRARKVK